ncbi:MAG TPA: hypothetical protein VGF75_03580 [Candidatus Saccharimonadales bacterium]|jgi:hypothetical protein
MTKKNIPVAHTPNKAGSGHPTVKKVGAMNNNPTTPAQSQFTDPAQAQAARGNGPVSLPGEQPQGTLGRSADAGVSGAYQTERMPANIPNIPGF